MKKFSFLLASAFLSLAASAFAYPFDPSELYTVYNGGDSLSLRFIGDEYYSRTLTEDGFLVVCDSSETFYYADENGEASKFVAKNADKRSAAEQTFLNNIDQEKALESHRQKSKNTNPLLTSREDVPEERSPWVPVATETGVELVGDAPGAPPKSLVYLHAPEFSKGNLRFPIILVEGNDNKTMDSAYVYAMLNEEGFSQNSHIGSVRDYFIDQSFGVFAPSFDVFLVSESRPYKDFIKNEGEMVQRAIAAMREKYPTFDASLYDSDNDGEIDAFGVLFSGRNFYSNGIRLGGFHTWFTRSDTTLVLDAGQGKSFDNGFILPQKDKLLANFIHEFSHAMGLKDHYCTTKSSECDLNYSDKEYQAPGAFLWDVMAYGTYINGGRTPPGYSAFERGFMKWITFTDLKTSSVIKVLPPLHSSNVAYYHKANNNEFFVFENRQKGKWDAHLPNHGMLIWHIEFNSKSWTEDRLNDSAAHQRVDIIEAGTLRVNTTANGRYTTNLKDDTFPGSQNVTEYGTIYAWDNRKAVNAIYSIIEKDSLVCFTLNPLATIEDGDCVYVESSSSSQAESSSSAERKSSSSQAVSSSSERRTFTHQVVQMPAGIRIATEGSTLLISSAGIGLKTVHVFDVQGQTLATATFTGSEYRLHLNSNASKGPHVVQVKTPQGNTLLLTNYSKRH